MDIETLAEIICNLNDMDPNNEADWETGLALARRDIKVAEEDPSQAWWTWGE